MWWGGAWLCRESSAFEFLLTYILIWSKNWIQKCPVFLSKSSYRDTSIQMFGILCEKANNCCTWKFFDIPNIFNVIMFVRAVLKVSKSRTYIMVRKPSGIFPTRILINTKTSSWNRRVHVETLLFLM